MKVLTVLGTRPEIIRLSRVIAKLDRLCDHVLVHTGQNFDANLSDIFFSELEVRAPDHYLGVKGDSFGEQVGQMMTKVDAVLAAERPDRLLVLGDTNSGLSAILAKRRGIPVYHMEAGNRCYDDRVPEEVNRRVIDHSSDVLLPYTERSRQNLLDEGIPGRRIYVTGNPIREVIEHYDAHISSSRVHERLGLERGRYVLVTMHRAENVDVRDRLAALMEALDRVAAEYQVPVIVSLHPRTQQRLAQFGVSSANPGVRFVEPPGFFEFVALEKAALCVLSDSGTVQEECSIFRVPNVTLRDTTERPETIDCGSNILSGVSVDGIMTGVRTALADTPAWEPPPEYMRLAVADTVCRIVMAHLEPRR